MLQAYLDEGMEDIAVFEFFVRTLPANRNFLLAAGLDQVLQYLEALRFSPDELEWLDGSGRFHGRFIAYLESLRFTGDIHAMPEGTVFFPNEPVLRVTAPMPQAQLVESRLINLLNFEILVATKAARCVLAAPGKLLVDFGLRRAHGGEAGLLAARASYLAGFSGTATVLAGRDFGVPIFGTMAHSYIQAHDLESDAFERFAASQPAGVTLLIDTYDTEAAAEKVVAIAPKLRQRGVKLAAVRLDSGDLAAHARKVRAILDRGGLGDVHIFCSGSLDEWTMARMLSAGAPLDGFGIGTHLTTSSDAPYFDSAYKLQAYAGRPRRKRSEGKATWPGAKQVYRCTDDNSQLRKDVVMLDAEVVSGTPLLGIVMRGGARLTASVPLERSRALAASELAWLPPPLRSLEKCAEPYVVEISPSLTALAAALDRVPH
jgi:nicotinate phosphoribosyltransferase